LKDNRYAFVATKLRFALLFYDGSGSSRGRGAVHLGWQWRIAAEWHLQ
jgi:hypothetical protein